jgi:hypothetical protein
VFRRRGGAGADRAVEQSDAPDNALELKVVFDVPFFI